LLAEARTIMGQRRMVRFSGIADDSPPAPRILIFKEFQRDQLLLVLDAAEDSLAPIP
jgi:hypothetical protein